MKTKVKIPKGWRRLRARTIIRRGDKFAYAKSPDGDDWYPTDRIGERVGKWPKPDYRLYIRKSRRLPNVEMTDANRTEKDQ